MISFFICLAILICGYLFYGKVVDRIFNPDDRETPAVAINDGVDYVVMPQWKLFLVQLLNIAGLGPIFGAIGGAGALLAKCIKKCELIAYEDLGAEALRKLYVEDMPLVVIIDSEGNNLYETGRAAYLNQQNA